MATGTGSEYRSCVYAEGLCGAEAGRAVSVTHGGVCRSGLSEGGVLGTPAGCPVPGEAESGRPGGLCVLGAV